tara:strand:- start:4086 stop:5381 length:1296 start_codon:yes stop_codon:yes gene_type:complete
MSNIDIKVPNIGDFENVEIIEILVKSGQNINKGDSIVTLESDKSSVEVPADHSGKITKINVKVGDKVSEGDLILKIEAINTETIDTDNDKINIPKEIDIPKENNKVPEKVKQNTEITSLQNINNINKSVLASPKVRKFARELGTDINKIPGSEKLGRVTQEDVKSFIKLGLNQNQSIKNNDDTKKPKIKIEYEHSEFGDVDVKDIPRIKKLAAPHLVNSFNTIPHVTHHDEIDITEMEEFRNSLVDHYTGEKLKITPLAFIMKALVAALKKFPSFNSSIEDMSTGKIILKKYFHIGIAVDTPGGLMVPKIRQVDKKNIQNLSLELREVAQKCRDLKIDKKEFYGGSITISSLGGIGGSFFTPIINYPEVAILGISKSKKQQISIGDKFKVRTILPISLSYDHRIIDGAEAARFCNEIRDNLGKNFAFKLAI